MNPKLRLQHENASLTQLIGAECGAMLVVRSSTSGWIGPLFLMLDSIWHRVYLDAGLVFWLEGEAPERDELLDDERFDDWGAQLELRGASVVAIEFADSRLKLTFTGGGLVILECRPRDLGTSLVEFEPCVSSSEKTTV